MGDRKAHSFIFLFALLMGVVPRPVHSQTTSSLWGRPVTSLHLKCDAHLQLSDFPDAIVQQVNEPLDPAKVAETLKRLYASGRFTDLRAEATAEKQGVGLTFEGRAQYFIGVVSVEGNPGPIEATALTTVARLRLGQPLTEEGVAAAQKHLTDLLVANAYHQSHIRTQLNRNPDTQEVNPLFIVQAGPAARVSQVDFQHQAPFASPRLMRISGWHPGMQLTATRAEHELFRLHQYSWRMATFRPLSISSTGSTMPARTPRRCGSQPRPGR